MRPYLVEGLDCSGKKAIVSQVNLLLQKNGYSTDVIIGPTCSKMLREFDRILVNSFFIKPGSFRDKVRKNTYTLEPVLDGIFYKEKKELILKVSSHYRAWARAIVEKDTAMVYRFERYAKKHLKFEGATLLWTDFEERLIRHRSDFVHGKTNKIEAKRFFDSNKSFFDSWHNELKKLMKQNINSILFIDTTSANIDDISKDVFNHILECMKNNETSKHNCSDKT